MPTRPATVPWDRDPHTAAKHAIYRRYLDKWFPILINTWGGDVTYAEGFAGPGIYTRGEAGSPVIALRTLLNRTELKQKVRHVRLLFVDADTRCISHLRHQIDQVRPSVALAELRERHHIDVQIEHGRCEPTLEDLLTRTDAWDHPMLVVLDTFGGAVSARLLQRIAANRAGEVIVTMLPGYFTRFAEGDITEGDSVFGSTAWRQVSEQPSHTKSRFLLQCYRDTVAAAGFRFVLDFELINPAGQSLFLVFGTNHDKGLEKMKEVMWEVDDVTGVRYRDPRDPDQQSLDIEEFPQTAPLRRILVDFLRDQPGQQARVVALREFAFFESVYKRSQVLLVLQQMASGGRLRSDSADGTVKMGSTVVLTQDVSAQDSSAGN